MKTTDSVMREFDEKWDKYDSDFWQYLNGDPTMSVSKEKIKAFISHSLAEARREERTKIYHDLLNKQEFVTYKKDGGHGSAVPMSWVLDLLTGDTPESECKVCHRTSDVVDMSKCPFCEHDQELIKEGRAMSDFDTRRGV